MGRISGKLGTALVEIVTPGLIERMAEFVADVWRHSSEPVWIEPEEEEEEEEYREAPDPIEAMDQTEIVQLIRREEFSGVGVDYRGLDVDTALSIIFRAAVQLLLEDLIEFEEDDESGTEP